MPRVIHTAQALVDAVMEVPALPTRGGNVMASSYQRYAGGAVTILLAAALVPLAGCTAAIASSTPNAGPATHTPAALVRVVATLHRRPTT